jgi:hypothetical protein
MFRSRWSRGALLAAPGLLLSGFGAVHPAGIDASTARWWATLHILLLPVFPLLAAAQWVLLADAPAVLRWPGRLAAFGFAAFYSGLDAVAGIAAGTVVHAEHGLTPVLGELFATGDLLGHIGTGCFLAASALIVAAIGRHDPLRTVPGAVLLLAGGVSFIDSHIFWPRGVFTMIAIAAGMFLLALVSSAARTPAEPTGDGGAAARPRQSARQGR